MERETKKIVTPISKQEVELKTWLTGREKRLLTNLFLDKATVSEGKVSDLKLTSEIINKAQDIAFETVVVSIGGKKGDIVNSILDMRGEDTDFIVSEINKITTGGVEDKVAKK